MRLLPLIALLACLAAAAPALAAPLAAMTLDADGTVHADGIVAPLSSLVGPEAQAALNAKLHDPGLGTGTADISRIRALTDASQAAILARWRTVYDLDIQAAVIGGVQTDIVTPRAGVSPRNRRRVLINLHGGGFFSGGRFGGQAESAPLAGRGRIKVVAVDYRLAPEHVFPAASQDVEKVYAALLKTHRARDIGIYGCSAGGALTAQVVAWLQSRGLPRPGAVGVFCSGAMPSFWYGGDSGTVNAVLNAAAPRPPGAGPAIAPFRPYFEGADLTSALVTPGLHPEVLARFPPTLIVTGSRDVAMSNALVTNLRLLQAGVETQLLVLEGVGHGQFNEFVETPETAAAYDVIWRFFDRHLGL